jgi:transposase InsO family protein
MSRARLVITAVVFEGRGVRDVARSYGVSPGWVSRLVARYREEGDAAFEPRSRRPKRSPHATPPEVVDAIIRIRRELTAEGNDAGPDTICWHLTYRFGVTVSVTTIARVLTRSGLVTPAPQKRPKSSYVRFEAEMPNETWQSDFTHHRLADGSDTEIITWLDDHSRLALRITAYRRITGPIVLEEFRRATADYGVPASTLTDNGLVYTTRLAGGRGGRNSFESELRRLGVTQKNSRPNHPTTCGKVERFQQTMKKWLRAQPVQPATIAELNVAIEQFRQNYNTARPHRSLAGRSTPAAAYLARPKAIPGDRASDANSRIRRDRVDEGGSISLRIHGRMVHIGVGRTLATTPVLLLIHDLEVRVVHAATGELIRSLTVDPTRSYQGTGAPKGPTRK